MSWWGRCCGKQRVGELSVDWRASAAVLRQNLVNFDQNLVVLGLADGVVVKLTAVLSTPGVAMAVGEIVVCGNSEVF